MKNLKKISLVIFTLFLLFGLLVFLINSSTKLPFSAESIEYQGSSFDLVSFAADEIDQIEFYYKDEKNDPYLSIENLKNSLLEEGQSLVFATNGGIFSQEREPLGLYVEAGETLHELNLEDGLGIKEDGTLIFAISNEAINFHHFASLFKEELGARDALYLDGAISELYLDGQEHSGIHEFSTLIGVSQSLDE
jgi:uncharacterized protein YigE (DUF2233 family)